VIPLWRFLLCLLALGIAVATGADAAAAAPWQADPLFRLDPGQLPGTASGATRIGYLVRDSQGSPVRTLDREAANPLDWIEVPPVPGTYTVEGWLEDSSGKELRRASTTVFFDDAAPAPSEPEAPARWLLGTEAAVLKINPPDEPLPLSGLRGYAVSLDRGGGSSPCASPFLCAAAEIDLAAGSGNSLALGTLPEGINYARVAAVSGAGVPSLASAVVFEVDATPPALSLQGLPGGWSDSPLRLNAFATDQLSGMKAAGPLGPYTAIAVDGGAQAAANGDTVSAWVSGSGVHEVELSARDAAGNVAGGSPSEAVPVRIDEEAPRVEFAPAQDPAEPERIEAFLTDPLSGPSQSRGSIAVRLAGTRARFEELPTRVEAGRLTAHWDSDSYPLGKYEFLATGFDRAGNAGLGTNRTRGGKMILVNPLKKPVSLATKLSGLRFAGRLWSVAGGAVAEQEIAVTETFAAGAHPRRRTTLLRTGADGSFSLRLGPGPSRDVVALFGGNRVLTRAAGSSVHLAAATPVQLRASAAAARVGGKPIVFSGKVRAAGARQAVRDLPVELQFRYRGGGWSEFRTVETDARGRFRYAYRFSDDDSRGVRFQFRAYVKGREGWPYEPGTSRPVLVTGR
jgi:hypothetical protein